MEFTINAEEKKALLSDARETITARLERREPVYHRTNKLSAATVEGSSALCRSCGAFVTLHLKEAEGERLRGCIGRLAASGPLETTVRTMAAEAAFGDPRFPPLSTEEFPRCRIEISALSPLRPCSDSALVQVGVHGLYLIYGGRAGVLLPQVPVEQGWNREQYLDYICIKAGVPPTSYRAPGAELFTFTAAVFGETRGT
ncbi:MAG: AmmeMemoRadiSam system protein A [Spirochaetaceae bacterium]|jgi:AmmeMemoRadiSam system protein A|nr:AmmeMemoRadiSam system protein A [Spirochaetaceae bacterium]